jgi:RNA-directed DNA polymerase
VEIPKPAGGVRALGIPTVLDRLIQQAVRQALQADWDPRFSEASFGFRPGRSAHQAVARAQEYIAAGYGWVVDIDLEKFFDRVNHDILMGLVAKRVSDRRRNPARGSDRSLNAKGNFRFERTIVDWRSGFVLDLRRKE